MSYKDISKKLCDLNNPELCPSKQNQFLANSWASQILRTTNLGAKPSNSWVHVDQGGIKPTIKL